jgi:hypothetical protein
MRRANHPAKMSAKMGRTTTRVENIGRSRS